MKTKELRTLLNAKLSTIAKTYYNFAMDNKPKEYLVYTINEINTEDYSINAQLEVNVMGYGKDTEPVENMADKVQKLLDHQFFITDKIAIESYQTSRNTLTEEDKNIVRRRLVFDLRIYERNE